MITFEKLSMLFSLLQDQTTDLIKAHQTISQLTQENIQLKASLKQLQTIQMPTQNGHESIEQERQDALDHQS